MREIRIFEDPEKLTDGAARLFVEIATDSIAASGCFTVALSGGSTPRSLFQLLASDKFRTAVDWHKVEFFFGDERNVPQDSPDSNFRMANESLLEPLSIDGSKIHRWQTELADPNAVAADYETTLVRHLSNRSFDLVLLGLGEDCHTASLFPGTAALREREKRAVANWVEKLNDFRFTITFPVINAARNIVFLVSGRGKAAAVKRVIEGENDPDHAPAQAVTTNDGALYWLLDRDAAALLESR